MGADTKIEWTDHTFNPWVGCTKVSPGCDHCYAEGWAKRSGHVQWGAGAARRRTSAANWRLPVKWDEQSRVALAAWQRFRATCLGATDADLQAEGFIKPRRPRVFCASLADVFDNEVPQEWRRDLFALIAITPRLDWQLLTKRIGNVSDMVAKIATAPRMASHAGDLMAHHWRNGEPPANVSLGASIVNQPEADRDIQKLLATPAAKRFLSMEPLLGPVDLTPFLWGKHEAVDPICQNCPRDADCECGYHTRRDLKLPAIDWVIVGGESGPKARPMHPQWAQSLRDQCNAAGVPFLFKQWGGRTSKSGGRELDGLTHDGYPDRG